MIQLFFNLSGLPFDKSIKPNEIFLSASAKELLSRLEIIKQRRGIMLITGEPGTGKTTILRSFVNQLSQLTFQSFYCPISTLNVLDFYRQLNHQLGGQPHHFKSHLFRSIQKTIHDFVTQTKKIPIIILDEAHLLKNENFFELQIISNPRSESRTSFNMDSSDPAIFILCGQSHLQDRLSCSFLSSFAQRIYLKSRLTPLLKDEIEPYISHHLALVGRPNSPFSPQAIEAIYKYSGGIPRLIGSLAQNTLACGMLEKTDLLTEEHVLKASYEI